ncbi:hypothetical protein CEXT_314551 [Caerostris extrusa]|uniref:Uncharacterized protein n=1 Tax=Caerostris extrusa TaxID=172846 RepID=A0AAV4X1K0_CAEEX|nr:hypothetical protein CEXT_314551 [Caerostris extrusa]
MSACKRCGVRGQKSIHEGNLPAYVNRRTAFPQLHTFLWHFLSVHIERETFPPACIFSGEEKHPERISTLPDRYFAFARGYGCAIPRNGSSSRSKKEKKKEAVLEHISALSCVHVPLLSNNCHIHFHFLCARGNQIGAVLPTVSASRKFSSPISYSLKKSHHFNGGIDSCLCYSHPFALIREKLIMEGVLSFHEEVSTGF